MPRLHARLPAGRALRCGEAGWVQSTRTQHATFHGSRAHSHEDAERCVVCMVVVRVVTCVSGWVGGWGWWGIHSGSARAGVARTGRDTRGRGRWACVALPRGLEPKRIFHAGTRSHDASNHSTRWTPPRRLVWRGLASRSRGPPPPPSVTPHLCVKQGRIDRPDCTRTANPRGHWPYLGPDELAETEPVWRLPGLADVPFFQFFLPPTSACWPSKLGRQEAGMPARGFVVGDGVCIVGAWRARVR